MSYYILASTGFCVDGGRAAAITDEKQHMWPDNETRDDLLGLKVHAYLTRAVAPNPQVQFVTAWRILR